MFCSFASYFVVATAGAATSSGVVTLPTFLSTPLMSRLGTRDVSRLEYDPRSLRMRMIGRSRYSYDARAKTNMTAIQDTTNNGRKLTGVNLIRPVASDIAATTVSNSQCQM